MSDNEARMTFTEHLAELRTRIIRSGIAIIVAVLACYAVSNQLFDIVTRPMRPLIEAGAAANKTAQDRPQDAPQAAPAGEQAPKTQWVALNFVEAFLVKLKLAAYVGLILASPIVIYQLCAFIFPGLTPTERRLAQYLLGGSGILAVCGVSVAYFCVLPTMLPYLMQMLPADVLLQFRMSENVSLIMMMLLGFAIAFQFPMVAMILVYLGLLSPAVLKRFRRVAIVVLAVASAILTPSPDPISMMMMLVPLALLYEASIWLSYLVLRRKRAADLAAKTQ